MFSCFFAIFDLKIRMQYFQYFQGLKIELIIPFVLKNKIYCVKKELKCFRIIQV